MKFSIAAWSLLFVAPCAMGKAVRGSSNQGLEDVEAARRKLLAHHYEHRVADIPTHHLGGGSINLRALNTGKNDNGMCYRDCDADDVVLADYPQWREEEGYWIGEYTFYQSDGTPFSSQNWNYRYDAYRGFITGNVQGNAYRQRNVFFYPPQLQSVCDDGKNSVQGVGECGVHGNTRIFSADQKATVCSTNPELGGDIEGPFDVFDTKTELVGKDNALLYQVFLFGDLFQSQLTTLSVDSETGTSRRTRSAQNFAQGLPTSLSFYRERKVDKDTFYAEMEATIAEYNILESDICTWKDNPTFDPPIIETGLQPGIDGCTAHLEESFDL